MADLETEAQKAEARLMRRYLLDVNSPTRMRVILAHLTFRLSVSLDRANFEVERFGRFYAREMGRHIRGIAIVDLQPNHERRPHAHVAFGVIDLFSEIDWLADDEAELAMVKRSFCAACRENGGSIEVNFEHQNSLRYLAKHRGAVAYRVYCPRTGACRRGKCQAL